MADLRWQDRAQCLGADANLFFHQRSDSPEHVVKAKRICAVCPVKAECLEFAITNNEQFGVWGGLTPREYRKIYLRRKGHVYATR